MHRSLQLRRGEESRQSPGGPARVGGKRLGPGKHPAVSNRQAHGVLREEGTAGGPLCSLRSATGVQAKINKTSLFFSTKEFQWERET